MVRPGDTVGDRYQVIEPLASGGMGTLWRARHVELDVDVALKVITTGQHDAHALERFKQEAKAAARLRNPNIVQVLDFGVFEGVPFIAMELLRGEDLASRIARERRLEPADCVRILKGMARAVQFAHDEGVIHRDLKPANVFLEKVGADEVVKILDFGVAKDLQASLPSGGTSAGALVGSPAYMSPEQVWGEAVGFASDIWAMGVVAFEMLTGKNPFDDTKLAKIFERIVREPLPSACTINPALPPGVDAFFERALARAAAARIGSAAELVQELEAALGGHAGPPGPSPFADTDGAGTPSRFAVTARSRARGRAGARHAVLVLLGLATAAIGAALLVGRGNHRDPATVRAPAQGHPERAPNPAPSTADAAQPSASAPGTATSPAPSASSATKPVLPRPKRAPSAAPVLDPRFGVPVNR